MSAEERVQEVEQAQEHHEGRLSTMEAHLEHVSATVDRLAGTMEKYFEESRRYDVESQTRQDKRISEVHARVDSQVELNLSQGRVSWPLILSAIMVTIAVGAIIVGFVSMRLNPVQQRMEFFAELQSSVESKMLGDDKREQDDAATFSRLTGKLDAAESRLDKLENWHTWSIREKLITNPTP